MELKEQKDKLIKESEENKLKTSQKSNKNNELINKDSSEPDTLLTVKVFNYYGKDYSLIEKDSNYPSTSLDIKSLSKDEIRYERNDEIERREVVAIKEEVKPVVDEIKEVKEEVKTIEKEEKEIVKKNQNLKKDQEIEVIFNSANQIRDLTIEETSYYSNILHKNDAKAYEKIQTNLCNVVLGAIFTITGIIFIFLSLRKRLNRIVGFNFISIQFFLCVICLVLGITLLSIGIYKVSKAIKRRKKYRRLISSLAHHEKELKEN